MHGHICGPKLVMPQCQAYFCDVRCALSCTLQCTHVRKVRTCYNCPGWAISNSVMAWLMRLRMCSSQAELTTCALHRCHKQANHQQADDVSESTATKQSQTNYRPVHMPTMQIRCWLATAALQVPKPCAAADITHILCHHPACTRACTTQATANT
jgi:hypothetical protein